jgi:hypothetical protein
MPIHSLTPPKQSFIMEQEDILDPSVLDSGREDRPTAITVICILGFAGAAISIPFIFTGAIARVGNWYPPYLVLSTIVGLASMMSLWNMRKWGVYLYTGFFLLTQAVLFVTGLWKWNSLIIPCVVIAIAFNFIKRMR